MAEEVELKITLKKGGGATNAFITIDNKGVTITKGKGTIKVAKDPPAPAPAPVHTYVVHVEGLEGAFAEYEIKETKEPTAGKPTVSEGMTGEVEDGEFQLA